VSGDERFDGKAVVPNGHPRRYRKGRETVVPTSVRHTLAYNRKAEVREAPKIRLGVPRRDALSTFSRPTPAGVRRATCAHVT